MIIGEFLKYLYLLIIVIGIICSIYFMVLTHTYKKEENILNYLANMFLIIFLILGLSIDFTNNRLMFHPAEITTLAIIFLLFLIITIIKFRNYHQ